MVRRLDICIVVLAVFVGVPWSSHGQEISPRLIAGQLGENVTIMCTSPRPNEAENNRLQVYIPATDVIELLDGDPRLNRVSDIGALTTYMFGPLVASDNGTIVSCTTSQMNSPNATIVVTFRAIITRTPESPQGDPVELRVGQTATIRLNIMANPPPSSFMWTKDGERVTSGNGLTFALDSITINFAREEHKGTYTLEATNLAGPAFYNFTLDVLSPPGFQANYVSPSNANCNEDGITISCAVSPGERIELLCGVTGNPLPNVTSSVGSDNRIVFDRAMASDAGNYTCIASSDKFPQGNITRRFRLLVGGSPQSLNRVDAMIDTSDGTVEFTWEYNNSRNGVPASGFIVAIKRDGQDVITDTLSIDQRSYTVLLSRLMGGETYTMEVIVRNMQGDSEPISQIFNTPKSSGVESSASYLLSLLLFVMVMVILY